MKSKWAVIADDLTGACDTGAAFKNQANRVKVILHPDTNLSDADVLVFSTSSRSMTKIEMHSAILAVIDRLSEIDALRKDYRFYKKIDSTLRGNPGGEFHLIRQFLGASWALIAPAFPEQGRVVRNSKIWVNDIPLEETIMGKEILEGDLLKIFGEEAILFPIGVADIHAGVNSLETKFASMNNCVLVADTETEDDLSILAKFFLQTEMKLACGSAGLARALARLTGSAERGQPEKILNGGAVLVVAGSRHPVTRQQIMAGKQAGFAEINLPADLRIDNIIDSIGKERYPLKDSEGHCMVTCHQTDYLPGEENKIAERLAEITKIILEGGKFSGLVLTGGDTAAAVCRILNVKAIDLLGEITPGIVWGTLEGGLVPGMRVVLKAGGFGKESSLVDGVRFLCGEGLKT